MILPAVLFAGALLLGVLTLGLWLALADRSTRPPAQRRAAAARWLMGGLLVSGTALAGAATYLDYWSVALLGGLAAALGLAGVLVRPMSRRQAAVNYHLNPRFCGRCGYELRGRLKRCPECGWEVPAHHD